MILGTFLDISSSEITAMLGYTKNLISDITPLLLPILGISVAIIIIYAIVNAIK